MLNKAIIATHVWNGKVFVKISVKKKKKKNLVFALHREREENIQACCEKVVAKYLSTF